MGKEEFKRFSPYFTYYFSRLLDGNDSEGISSLSAMRVSIFKGICEEDFWDESKGYDEIPINQTEILDNASKYWSMYFFRTDNIEELKYQIAVNQLVPQVAFYLFDNIHLADLNGILRHPNRNSKTNEIHSVVLIGYNDRPYTYENGIIEKGFLIFLNSWGEDWGDNGRGYMSHEYFKKHVLDCCVLVSEKNYFSQQTNDVVYRYMVNDREYRLWIGRIVGFESDKSDVITSFLFDDKGEKIGYISAGIRNSKTVEILDFFVWPDYRFNGFGELILGTILDLLIEEKYSLIFGWISNVDLEKDGFYMIAKFFTDKKFEYVNEGSTYNWSKYIFFGKPKKIRRAIKNYDLIEVKKF